MKKFLAILVLVGMVALPGSVFADKPEDAGVSGGAKIWLDADGGTYVNANSDPWLTDGLVIGAGDFDLEILNTDNKDTIYDAMIVLAIPHDITDTGWSFTLGGTTFNYASFTGTGLHPVIEPHGVFAKEGGALWTEFSVGDLAPEETKKFAFSGQSPTDGVFLHFDAYGSTSDTIQDGKFSTPNSHDVTVTPEPMSMVLFGLGGLPIAAHLLRRRKTAA